MLNYIKYVYMQLRSSRLYFVLLSQGILITHNASARVIRSNQSLVLQKVTRNSSGAYSCSAINAEGETVSNQQPLRVKCKCLSSSPSSLLKITFPKWLSGTYKNEEVKTKLLKSFLYRFYYNRFLNAINWLLENLFD